MAVSTSAMGGHHDDLGVAARSLASDSRSRPLPSGISRSVRTTAYGSGGAEGLARRREAGGGSTSSPRDENRIASMSRSPGSSSTTRTVPLCAHSTALYQDRKSTSRRRSSACAMGALVARRLVPSERQSRSFANAAFVSPAFTSHRASSSHCSA